MPFRKWELKWLQFPIFSSSLNRIPQFWKTTTGSRQWVSSERPDCSLTCRLRTGSLGNKYSGLLAVALKWVWSHVCLFNHSMNMERELGSLILATDISRQNDYLSRFRTHLDQESLCLSNASHRHFVLQVGYPHTHIPSLHYQTSARQQTGIPFFSPFPVQMALKCADICNPCRPWELSKQWSEKVTEEFFEQGICCMRCVWPLCAFSFTLF